MRVRDLRVLEGADDVQDRVDVANVAEEAVAETLALVGAAHEPRDVDELELLGHAAFDPERLAQRSSRASGTGTTATFGSTVVKGYSAASAPARAERVEERRLAGVREADDADLHEAASSAAPTRAPTAAPTTTSEG